MNPACSGCEVVELCLGSVRRRIESIKQARETSQTNWQSLRSANPTKRNILRNYIYELNDLVETTGDLLETEVETFKSHNKKCPGKKGDKCGLSYADQYRMLPYDVGDDPVAQVIIEKIQDEPH